MKADTGFKTVDSSNLAGSSNERAGFESLGLFEALYGVLFQPVLTIKKLAAAEPVSLAVFISFLVSLAAFAPRIADRAVVSPNLAPIFLLALLTALINLLLLFTGVLFFTLFARFLGGDSNYFGFFSAAGVSQFVLLLYPVVVFISRIAGLPDYLGLFLRILLLVWYYLLFLISLRESQKISSIRAALTVGVTVAAFAVLIFLLGAGTLALMFSL